MMLEFHAARRAAPFGWMHAGAGLAVLHEAHRRNLGALLAANRTAVAGYQAVYVRMVERCAAHAAEARDRIEAMHGQPIDAQSASRFIADAGLAVESGLADLRGLTDLAKGTTADAFAILRRRAEEAMAELRTAGRQG